MAEKNFSFRQKNPAVFLSLLVLAITAFSYISSLRNGFTNWDDPGSVTENAAIRELSWKSAAGFFTDYRHRRHDFYKPLVLLSYAVEYHFFGLDPKIYHVTNLIFHLLNCLLVFRLILLLGEGPTIAFIVAAMFGVHPLHVESVAWVTQRKDLLYSFFFLASSIAYLKYIKNTGWKLYGLSLFCFLLSLLSKPMAVSLPAVLLLFDYLTKRPWNRRLILEKIPFFGLAIAFTFFTVWSTPDRLTPTSLLQPSHFLTVSDTLVFYLVKFIAPLNLSCCYPFPPIAGYLFKGIPSAAMVLIIAAIFLFLGRYSRRIVFGGLFFLATLLPTLQWAPNGFLAADHYTYIPSIGVFYLFAAGFKKIENRWKFAALVLMLGIFSYLTWQRCGVWKDDPALWGDVLTKYPDTVKNTAALKARNGLATYYILRQENEKALPQLDRVLQLDPADDMARGNRGVAYFNQRQYDKALSEFDEVLRHNPDWADIYNNRGSVYSAIGQHEKALEDYSRTLALQPDIAGVYFNRAREYSALGFDAKAIADYDRAILLDPQDLEARRERAALSQNRRQAAAVFKKIN